MWHRRMAVTLRAVGVIDNFRSQAAGFPQPSKVSRSPDVRFRNVARTAGINFILKTMRHAST
jgi:hypothetical protein